MSTCSLLLAIVLSTLKLSRVMAGGEVVIRWDIASVQSMSSPLQVNLADTLYFECIPGSFSNAFYMANEDQFTECNATNSEPTPFRVGACNRDEGGGGQNLTQPITQSAQVLDDNHPQFEPDMTYYFASFSDGESVASAANSDKLYGGQCVDGLKIAVRVNPPLPPPTETTTSSQEPGPEPGSGSTGGLSGPLGETEVIIIVVVCVVGLVVVIIVVSVICICCCCASKKRKSRSIRLAATNPETASETAETDGKKQQNNKNTNISFQNDNDKKLKKKKDKIVTTKEINLTDSGKPTKPSNKPSQRRPPPPKPGEPPQIENGTKPHGNTSKAQDKDKVTPNGKPGSVDQNLTANKNKTSNSDQAARTSAPKTVNNGIKKASSSQSGTPDNRRASSSQNATRQASTSNGVPGKTEAASSKQVAGRKYSHQPSRPAPGRPPPNSSNGQSKAANRTASASTRPDEATDKSGNVSSTTVPKTKASSQNKSISSQSAEKKREPTSINVSSSLPPSSSVNYTANMTVTSSLTGVSTPSNMQKASRNTTNKKNEGNVNVHGSSVAFCK